MVSYYIYAIVAVKKEKSEMSFKSSIRPSHPISEMATSHVCGIKRLEMRVIKIRVFFLSREWGRNVIYSECQVFEWLQWVGDHENGLNYIWKYIVLIGNNAFWHSAKVYLFLNFIHQYTIYWEKISNKKLSLRLIECYKKYTVFLSHELKCINAKILI